MTDKLVEQYESYGAKVKHVNNLEAAHAFPTDLERNENGCDYYGTPFINNCQYDGVGEMFSHILPLKEERKLDWKSYGKLKFF